MQGVRRGRESTDLATRGHFEATAAYFQRQNELILDAAGEGIYGLDLRGRVTFANPAAAGMTGHSVQELLGQSMHALVHHTGPDGCRIPPHACAIHAALNDGTVHHVTDEVFWRKDGSSFPVQYTSTPIREGDTVVGAVVVFQDISARREAEARLRSALQEVERLKEQLQAENAYLQQEIRAAHGYGRLVGSSPALTATLQAVQKVAPTHATVLLQGESGTGKELVARVLHELSPRRTRALVKVNCASLPPTLVESELFGHERGAFTGAVQQRRGRFELADGGTLFLDEVGELPLETQATLLRALQEGEFERVGGARTLAVDVRVVAATNRDLWTMVQEGSFRADLYYRLNVFPILLPPLRQRLEDIPELVASQLAQLSERLGRPITGITPESLERLMRYDFPGNVRELYNILERAAIVSAGSKIEVAPLRAALTDTSSDTSPPADVEASSSASGGNAAAGAPRESESAWSLDRQLREHIVAALEKTQWKVAGAGGAAELLGMHPNTLRSRMKRLRIPTRSDQRRDADGHQVRHARLDLIERAKPPCH